MIKITLTIDGMACGMCENHINDAIRKSFSVKKVTSSHRKCQTMIISENDIPDAELKSVIDKTGYTFESAVRETYISKGLFPKIKR